MTGRRKEGTSLQLGTEIVKDNVQDDGSVIYWRVNGIHVVANLQFLKRS